MWTGGLEWRSSAHCGPPSRLASCLHGYLPPAECPQRKMQAKRVDPSTETSKFSWDPTVILSNAAVLSSAPQRGPPIFTTFSGAFLPPSPHSKSPPLLPYKVLL